MDDVLLDDLMMMVMRTIDHCFCCYGDEECPSCEPFMEMQRGNAGESTFPRHRGSEET